MKLPSLSGPVKGSPLIPGQGQEGAGQRSKLFVDTGSPVEQLSKGQAFTACHVIPRRSRNKEEARWFTTLPIHAYGCLGSSLHSRVWASVSILDDSPLESSCLAKIAALLKSCLYNILLIHLGYPQTEKELVVRKTKEEVDRHQHQVAVLRVGVKSLSVLDERALVYQQSLRCTLCSLQGKKHIFECSHLVKTLSMWKTSSLGQKNIVQLWSLMCQCNTCREFQKCTAERSGKAFSGLRLHVGVHIRKGGRKLSTSRNLIQQGKCLTQFYPSYLWFSTTVPCCTLCSVQLLKRKLMVCLANFRAFSVCHERKNENCCFICYFSYMQEVFMRTNSRHALPTDCCRLNCFTQETATSHFSYSYNRV